MKFFKYLKEDRIENILIDNKIRFTQPKYFNDLFDVNPTIRGLNIRGFINKIPDDIIDNISDEIYKVCLEQKIFDKNDSSDELKKCLQSLKNFNNDELQEDFLEKVSNELLNKINNKIGILSLTKRNDNLHMWTHYANEHKGFVVEFDTNSEFFNFPQEVKYSLIRPSLKIGKQLQKDVFFTKGLDWEKEEELRIVKNLNEASEIKEDIFLFQFPKEFINAIYCGNKMLDTNKNKILEIIKKDENLKHIKVFDTKVPKKDYELKFEQIN